MPAEGCGPLIRSGFIILLGFIWLLPITGSAETTQRSRDEESAAEALLAVATLNISDAVVQEGNGLATFTVSRAGALGQTVTVFYKTLPGTAQSILDYQSVIDVLTFPPLDVSETVSIPVVPDLLYEGSEYFFVELFDATITGNNNEVIIEDGTGKGTILDDDSPPFIHLDDTTVTEADAKNVIATFVITLSTESGLPASVSYHTEDETAVAGADYAAASGTITFPAGETSRTIEIVVIPDTKDEFDETFLVILSNPTGAELENEEGQAKIIDNDPLPKLSINDITVNEIAGVAGFTVRLSPASGREVRVNFASSSGTATSGVDFGATSGTLVIPAGNVKKVINVALKPDYPAPGGGAEGNETFFVTLSNAHQATISDAKGQANLIDNAFFAPLVGSPEPCVAYEPNNTFVQAKSNANISHKEGITTSGAFCGNDPDDFYYVQLTTTDNNQQIQVNLDNVPDHTDLDLYLYDSTGTNILAFSYAGLEGEPEELVYTIPDSGDHIYFIRVFPYLLGDDATNPYQLLWDRQ